MSFMSIENSFPLDHFEEDYKKFRIVEIDYEDGKNFLLSTDDGRNKKDFMISDQSIREVIRNFPSNKNKGRVSILHEFGYLRILGEVYSKIIGKNLIPMDTESLESEF